MNHSLKTENLTAPNTRNSGLDQEHAGKTRKSRHVLLNRRIVSGQKWPETAFWLVEVRQTLVDSSIWHFWRYMPTFIHFWCDLFD